MSIEGNATIISNYDDYKVYFSKVLVNGEEDDGVVDSETRLVFDVRLVEPGEEYVLTYDVTNGSKYFDASVTMSCTGGDANIGIDNQFDTSDLPALSSRTGILTVKKLKSNSSQENIAYSITCNLVAESVDRTSPGSGEVASPLEPIRISVGDVMTIANESFNVISQTDTTVTMLAQFTLGPEYRQSEIDNEVVFSDGDGWEYTPGPKEIDIQTWSTNPKTYVNEYVSYLKKLTLDDSLNGNLITVSELMSLGCTGANADYTVTGNETCKNSEHYNWLVTSQFWWTRSAYPGDSTVIWRMTATENGGLYAGSYMSGNYGEGGYDVPHGIRPIITLSKNSLYKAIKKSFIEFSIGDVSYVAEEGMTWGEWVDSEYNTDLEFNIVTFNGSDRLVPAPTDYYDSGVALHYGAEPQTTETVIQHGYAYTLGCD